MSIPDIQGRFFNTYIYIYNYIHIHAYVLSYMHTKFYKYICILTNSYTNIQTYVHMNTHTDHRAC